MHQNTYSYQRSGKIQAFSKRKLATFQSHNKHLFCGKTYVMLNVVDISPIVKEELMCCHVLVYM